MSVNLPNLTMNIGKRSRYRVRLIHRNVPGVMARVNSIFASSEANVDAQILATVDEVGYVLTDSFGRPGSRGPGGAEPPARNRPTDCDAPVETVAFIALPGGQTRP